MLRRIRAGFTLVELLVVIAIIGILMGLLLVAIGSARAKYLQVQCLNNIRQLGMAAIAFDTAKKRFPGSQEVIARDASLPLEYPATLPGATTNKIAPWQVLLLDYIEQRPLYDRWDDQTLPKWVPDPITGQPVLNGDLAHYVKNFNCPAQSSSRTYGPFTAFVANAGYYPLATDPAPYNMASSKGPTTAGYDYWDAQDGDNGMFVDRVPIPTTAGSLTPHNPATLPKVTMTSVGDGLSNTLLVSENLVAGQWWQSGLETSFVWLYATEPACPPSGGKPAPTQQVTPAMRINGLRNTVTNLSPQTARPSSRHTGGVNAVFADGHTAFLRDGVDYHVYQQLMTPNGAKSEMPCGGYVLKSGDFEY
ncbi:MAG: DUF1559 domain-containing protein [Planctomycetaceae bacterium]|nr:DUF1559 domain-containing protein [Planctomycetaceae bacterium]